MRGQPPADETELRVGDVVETSIEKVVYRGRGLGRVGGRVVFVPRTFAGDRVTARIKELRPGWAEAALEAVTTPAPHRRASPCEYVPRCGGCVSQELGYEAQLQAKEAVLRESLSRAGAPWEGEIPALGSPEGGWRIRAHLHFFAGRDGLGVGLREEGSRRVVDLARCLQLSTGANEAVAGLRDALQEHRRLWPRLRGLDLLESPDGGTRVVSLAGSLSPRDAARLASLGDAVPGLDGLGVETGRGRSQWLHGDPHIEAAVLGSSLRVHVRSFFQANRFLYETLARTVVDSLAGPGRALDLYAGVGLFAVPLAARSEAEVVAVERAPTSAADAKSNARKNGLGNLRIVRQGVREALAALKTQRGERIVLDPPRTGLEPGVVESVAERRPEVIVYVSCDPPTLGRDLARFAALGYRMESVRLLDLFPDTFHLETVVRLLPA